MVKGLRVGQLPITVAELYPLYALTSMIMKTIVIIPKDTHRILIYPRIQNGIPSDTANSFWSIAIITATVKQHRPRTIQYVFDSISSPHRYIGMITK